MINSLTPSLLCFTWLKSIHSSNSEQSDSVAGTSPCCEGNNSFLALIPSSSSIAFMYSISFVGLELPILKTLYGAQLVEGFGALVLNDLSVVAGLSKICIKQ